MGVTRERKNFVLHDCKPVLCTGDLNKNNFSYNNFLLIIQRKHLCKNDNSNEYF